MYQILVIQSERFIHEVSLSGRSISCFFTLSKSSSAPPLWNKNVGCTWMEYWEKYCYKNEVKSVFPWHLKSRGFRKGCWYTSIKKTWTFEGAAKIRGWNSYFLGFFWWGGGSWMLLETNFWKKICYHYNATASSSNQTLDRKKWLRSGWICVMFLSSSYCG